MCWFSAHETTHSREAIEGEDLVVQQLSDLRRRWLVSPRNTETAVCLRHGSQVRLTEIPENLQKKLRVGPEAIAVFQESHLTPRSFFQRLLPPEPIHDAFLFPNGSYCRVGQLPLGTKVDVLTIGKSAPRWESVDEWTQELTDALSS